MLHSVFSLCVSPLRFSSLLSCEVKSARREREREREGENTQIDRVLRAAFFVRKIGGRVLRKKSPMNKEEERLLRGEQKKNETLNI